MRIDFSINILNENIKIFKINIINIYILYLKHYEIIMTIF